MKTGIVYVKKANLWQFYEKYNTEHRTDHEEWFNKKEEAEARLEQN